MRYLRAIVASSLLGMAACSSDPVTSATPPAGASAVVFGGSGQLAVGGVSLPTPLTVFVKDSAGSGVAGTTVTWAVTAGGGSVSPTTSVTDANGHASTTFTLGSVIGGQAVTATIASITTPVVFTATNYANGAVTSPQLIATVPTPSGAVYAHDTYVRDGLAFAFMWNAGVRIYDVGNGVKGGAPSAPVLVGSLITATNSVPGGAQVHNGWWFHNPVTGQNKYLFIGQEGACGTIGTCSIGDIHIVDVSNMSAPVEVGFIHIAGAGVHNFWMDEANQTLYAAYYNAGVVKIDVSGTLAGDMSSRIVKQVLPGGAGNTYIWGVMLAGGTLYATDMLSGFWALDPSTLATKGGGNNVPERYGSDQWVSGQYAYSGTWSSRAGARGNAVKVWSLNGTGVPTLVDSLIVPNITTVSDVAVTADGKMLVITAEGGSGQGLYVYSRANPAKPSLVASVMTAQGLHTGEIAVINGRTYVFAARDPGVPQMEIYDITGLVQ